MKLAFLSMKLRIVNFDSHSKSNLQILELSNFQIEPMRIFWFAAILLLPFPIGFQWLKNNPEQLATSVALRIQKNEVFDAIKCNKKIQCGEIHDKKIEVFFNILGQNKLRSRSIEKFYKLEINGVKMYRIYKKK